MDKLIVEGGRPLKGETLVGGSKNAALPILFATLLTDEPCSIARVPDLRDIRTTAAMLEFLGKRVERQGDTVVVRPRAKLKLAAPYDLVKQMRASVLVAGPLLARFHKASVPVPGGCAIGLRPIDLHLFGFERLGARVTRRAGEAYVHGRLQGARVPLRVPSVGATENVLMAAVLAPGRTVIENAAREPEIGDLAAFLRAMGAKIEGEGTKKIVVTGVSSLHGAAHLVTPDRIEAGTFLIACAAAGGHIRLTGAEPLHLRAVLAKLKQAGCRVDCSGDVIELIAPRRPRAVDVDTRPYPGFPTDLQPLWMALMALARGQSHIHERIFEQRFMHAAELSRMGADIVVEGERVRVTGVEALSGAPVMASDLRAGAALLVAAAAASGTTVIDRVYHIDRGYERVEEKFAALGVRIKRVHS